VPLGAPSIPLSEMDARQQATYFAQQRIQAVGAGGVRSFTPAWTGFSVDPVGEISYMDLGDVVMVWTNDSLLGTSDATIMTITNLPDEISILTGSRLVPSTMVDNGTGYAGFASIGGSPNLMTFFLSAVSGSKVSYSSSTFTSSGDKGLVAGWLIVYTKQQ
jgi:hypothetical protein